MLSHIVYFTQLYRFMCVRQRCREGGGERNATRKMRVVPRSCSIFHFHYVTLWLQWKRITCFCISMESRKWWLHWYGEGYARCVTWIIMVLVNVSDVKKSLAVQLRMLRCASAQNVHEVKRRRLSSKMIVNWLKSMFGSGSTAFFPTWSKLEHISLSWFTKSLLIVWENVIRGPNTFILPIPTEKRKNTDHGVSLVWCYTAHN